MSAQGCHAETAKRGLATLGTKARMIFNPEAGCGRIRRMPQSLSAVFVHLIFSTKERRPFLRDPKIRTTTHQYLAGISKQLDCDPVMVGGVQDHVHMLCRLGRTISQSDWIKEVKRVSSAWLKEQSPDLRAFEWQGGYADFGVSVSNLDLVRTYIERQEEHHRKISFQDELRLLLKKHRLEWDEKYLWD
jgi:putative transposase